MIITIIFWLAFCILIGIWAEKLKRSGIGWFFISALISPLIAALILLIIKEKKILSTEPERKKERSTKTSDSWEDPDFREKTIEAANQLGRKDEGS